MIVNYMYRTLEENNYTANNIILKVFGAFGFLCLLITLHLDLVLVNVALNMHRMVLQIRMNFTIG